MSEGKVFVGMQFVPFVDFVDKSLLDNKAGWKMSLHYKDSDWCVMCKLVVSWNFSLHILESTWIWRPCLVCHNKNSMWIDFTVHHVVDLKRFLEYSFMSGYSSENNCESWELELYVTVIYSCDTPFVYLNCLLFALRKLLTNWSCFILTNSGILPNGMLCIMWCFHGNKYIPGCFPGLV